MAAKIRFGVLGTSRIAQKSAIPALLDSDHAQLAMIGSRNKQQAEEWARRYNCPLYGTYEDVLLSTDIDAVYISLPNALHEEWVLKAASAGKHIWVEKPAALTYTSAKKIINACREHNVRLMEGFTFLSHPQHDKVRELIAQDILGEPALFEGCFAFPRPDADSHLLDKKLGGGTYNDSAVYPIRASSMIFNEEPLSATCTLAMDPETGVDVRAEILLTYLNGRSALISSAIGTYFRSTYSILGSKGYLTTERAYAVPEDRDVTISVESGDTIQKILVEHADQFKLMIDQFCDEILRGKASTKKYEEDLLLQARILEAGRRSHTERRTVNLSEID